VIAEFELVIGGRGIAATACICIAQEQHATCTTACMPFRSTTPTIMFAALLASACAGSSPAAPTANDTGSRANYRGETVSALDGKPIPGVAIKIGTRSAVSDTLGRFELTVPEEGTAIATLSGSSIVERRRSVAIPADAAKETLIPSTFDLDAFDQMFRGTGQLQRWTSVPALVVLGSIMQYHSIGSDEYQATSEQLTDQEVTVLVEHLTEGLALLSGQRFTSFASVTVERPASGKRVNTLRTGAIVVGRYRGVKSLGNTIGVGRWSNNDNTAEINGGAMYLDHNFDRTSDDRRLLRIHELGHALGYLHVTTRPSIMNPSIGPLPGEFDREGAIIAFERAPGNQSPDTDSIEGPRSPGGMSGIRGLARSVWAPPIICIP
jgi:hypothetical protein